MYIYLRCFVFVYLGFPVRVFLASVRISLCVYLCTCVCVSADAKESGQRALSRAHATKHLLWETRMYDAARLDFWPRNIKAVDKCWFKYVLEYTQRGARLTN